VDRSIPWSLLIFDLSDGLAPFSSSHRLEVTSIHDFWRIGRHLGGVEAQEQTTKSKKISCLETRESGKEQARDLSFIDFLCHGMREPYTCQLRGR
jgi:hypothetical protein